MVGTELSKILAAVGIVPKPTCPCKDYVRMLDALGVGWARSNRRVVVGWLRAEAKKRRLPFFDWMGHAVVQAAIWKAALTRRSH